MRGEGIPFLNCPDNRLDNTIEIAWHIIVPHAQHAIAPTLEPLRSLTIVGRIFRQPVLRTIDFNNEPFADANEVDDIWANGMLPPEFELRRIEHSLVQRMPKKPFGICLICTRGTRFSDAAVHGLPLTFRANLGSSPTRLPPMADSWERDRINKRMLVRESSLADLVTPYGENWPRYDTRL